jgi:hypothetical protein
MFPKNHCDIQMLLTKYNLPVWSTTKPWLDFRECREYICLYIGTERKKPAIMIEIDQEEYLDNGNVNSAYRELKAYLDTHYTPVKLPRWPM